MNFEKWKNTDLYRIYNKHLSYVSFAINTKKSEKKPPGSISKYSCMHMTHILTLTFSSICENFILFSVCVGLFVCLCIAVLQSNMSFVHFSTDLFLTFSNTYTKQEKSTIISLCQFLCLCNTVCSKIEKHHCFSFSSMFVSER